MQQTLSVFQPSQSSHRFIMQLLIAVLFLIGLSGCATNPATGRNQLMLVSQSQEHAMGQEAHPQIVQQYGGIYQNAKLTAAVEEVYRRIVAQSEAQGANYSITILDSDIPNAFATAGGFNYITRGMLYHLYDEAELAGVLGHELGHLTGRHVASRQSRSTLIGLTGALLGAATRNQTASELFNLSGALYLSAYNRDQEREADMLGVRYMNGAGYDPYGLADFFTTLQARERLDALILGRSDAGGSFSFFSTHPQTAERVQNVVQMVRQLPAPPQERGRVDFLKALNGMHYGGSPEHGYVIDTLFIHPKLGIRFQFRPDDYVINGSRSVQFLGPDQTAGEFTIASVNKGITPAQYIQGIWAKGAPIQKIETTVIDGMPLATTVLPRSDGSILRLVALIDDAGRVYRFVFQANSSQRFAAADKDWQSVVASFRRLSAAEIAAFKPPRIRVIAVKPGETVASIARRMPFSTYQEERFRVLNGLTNGEQVTPGDAVKLVMLE